MEQPQRSEIWRVKHARRKQGTELGADKPEGDRACLIVSADDYNEEREGMTIVPLTGYREGREEARALWGIAITNYEDVEVDPRTARLGDRYEPFKKWSVQDKILYKSIIDCGQLWTVSKKRPHRHPENELHWNRRYGILKETEMLRVDAALQALIGGCIRFSHENPDEPPQGPQRGDVLELGLPVRGVPGMHRGRCLVVSSTGIDAIRERIQVYRKDDSERGSLSHCTVVTLVPIRDNKASYRHGFARVDVYPKGEYGKPLRELAVCLEIYTIDWRSRKMDDGLVKVGRVPNDHMERVQNALRDYLDLPR